MLLSMWSKFILATLCFIQSWSLKQFCGSDRKCHYSLLELSESCQLFWQSEAEFSTFTRPKILFLLNCPLNSYFSVNEKSLISQLIYQSRDEWQIVSLITSKAQDTNSVHWHKLLWKSLRCWQMMPIRILSL